MPKTPKSQALVLARERRIALDQERGARDRRVEQSVARALVAEESRAAVRGQLAELDQEIADALKSLTQDVSVQQAADLCGLDITEVRRLTRGGRRYPRSAEGSGAMGEPEAGGGPDQ